MNDEAFLEFVRSRKSVISGLFQTYHDSTDESGVSVAAHVRRAGPAGVAYKPKYSAVPLLKDEHDTQSWQGEHACLVRFLPDETGGAHLRSLSYVEGLLWAEAWFDEQRLLTLRAWLDTLPGLPPDLPDDLRARLSGRDNAESSMAVGSIPP
jgi:hypothetical protein